ncbi:hypothetical protein MASR2M17_07900 [Aminivibrio sp.]
MINLSPDKGRFFGRHGGPVREGAFPWPIRSFSDRSPGLKFLSGWCGCITGALSEEEYRTLLAAAGFVSMEVRPVKVYFAREALLEMMFPDLAEEDRATLKGALASASVTAVKPFP